MCVALFRLTSHEGRDAQLPRSSERHVVDVKASGRADDCRPRWVRSATASLHCDPSSMQFNFVGWPVRFPSLFRSFCVDDRGSLIKGVGALRQSHVEGQCRSLLVRVPNLARSSDRANQGRLFGVGCFGLST